MKITVSILVLMELPLQPKKGEKHDWENDNVSILVLMELPLQQEADIKKIAREL